MSERKSSATVSTLKARNGAQQRYVLKDELFPFHAKRGFAGREAHRQRPWNTLTTAPTSCVAQDALEPK